MLAAQVLKGGVLADLEVQPEDDAAVGEAIEGLQFNKSVAALYELTSAIEKAAPSADRDAAIRTLLMLVGVALTALVTATAGPIAFIALCAPQIARRMTRSAGVELLPSALTGGLLLLVILGSGVLWTEEIRKFLVRRRHQE